MDTRKALDTSDFVWRDSIVPALQRYIAIPNVSPHFDPAWEAHGYMDQAVELFSMWAESQPVEGLRVEVKRIDGRTPVILMEVPATDDAIGTVLLYGHLDKQPEMDGWREGLGPWKPVLEGDRLYGRGGADDGYAMFASVTAVRLLQEQKLPHGRIVILIEASEESGSEDLPAYMEAYGALIGSPDLVICLDSGCGNYDQLWTTTSLRGLVSGDLRVDILTEGVHSGMASGIVPDSFAIATQLLDRVRDSSGRVFVPELTVEIPRDRLDQAAYAAAVLGEEVCAEFPWVTGAHPDPRYNPESLLLQKTWRPSLTVIGVDGFPATLERSGNVLRPYTTLRLSFRAPPTADTAKAAEAIKKTLEHRPPYGAKVSFTPISHADGWNAPSLTPWLEDSIEQASQACFGVPSVSKGEGGTIPFMGMLGEQFPDAQFLITGVLGPHSNAHGPNEFLHIPMGIKLTAAVAKVINDHAAR